MGELRRRADSPLICNKEKSVSTYKGNPAPDDCLCPTILTRPSSGSPQPFSKIAVKRRHKRIHGGEGVPVGRLSLTAPYFHLSTSPDMDDDIAKIQSILNAELESRAFVSAEDANAFWLLFGTVTVFFMQAGFAMLEASACSWLCK